MGNSELVTIVCATEWDIYCHHVSYTETFAIGGSLSIVRILVLSAAGLLFVGSPITALAWGKFGHLTVCDLAYRNLTDDSKAALNKLMHSKSGGISVKGQDGVAKRTYTRFNLGCLEEDERPRKHPHDHFINVGRSAASITDDSCPGTGACVLSGIKRDFEMLKNASNTDEDRVFALMALGHWVGDIHQPLHVSFKDDAGGNAIPVKMMKTRCGRSTYRAKELHGVWDNCLLEAGMFERVRNRADFKSTWDQNTITYRAVDTLLVNTTHAEEKQLVGGAPWQWAQESYAITLDDNVHYCVHQGDNCQYSGAQLLYDEDAPRTQPIDAAYLQKFERLAQERVRLAGFRLADLINKALDPNYVEPIQNSTQRP
jgi:hypothetical protein